MVKPLDQFPPHVLSNILSGIAHGEKEDCQIGAIRVCSAFYLAGIPHVYRKPLVNGYSNLASFLLHIPLDPSVPLNTLSCAELVKMGHTKLAALRHVHHLQVTFPPLNNGIYHDNSHMSQEDRKNAFLSKKEEVERSIEAAEEKMKALAIGSMPNIEKVQIGEKLYQYESHPDDRAAELVKLLIGRVNPRVWCQYHDWRISSPVNDIAGDNVLLPILHRHIRTFDSFSIVLGSTNHIYIHREPLTIRQRAKPRLMIAERTCGYRAPKPYNLGDLSLWLERRIIDSLSVHGLDLDPRTQTIIDNTRIIIGGAAPQTGLRLLEGDQVDEFEGSKAIIKEIKKGLVNRGRKDLAGLQIQAEQARDMLPCPVCGAGLGGIADSLGSYP